MFGLEMVPSGSGAWHSPLVEAGIQQLDLSEEFGNAIAVTLSRGLANSGIVISKQI